MPAQDDLQGVIPGLEGDSTLEGSMTDLGAWRAGLNSNLNGTPPPRSQRRHPDSKRPGKKQWMIDGYLKMLEDRKRSE